MFRAFVQGFSSIDLGLTSLTLNRRSGSTSEASFHSLRGMGRSDTPVTQKYLP